MVLPVINVLLNLLNVAKILVIADALFSWGLPPTQFPRSITKALLDPVYAPVRRLLQPHTGSLDLAPLIALLLLFALSRWLESREMARN
jgi:uncharacterized protein YggT (Ycf19 family)